MKGNARRKNSIEEGENKKLYIERSGFKQKAVAEKSGLDEYKLCMSLKGKRKLEAGEYANICSALGVPMTMFIKPQMQV